MDWVIGIGNDLMGDDGAGARVVHAVAPRADLETMVIHQLVPELAEMLQYARRVLFVDACLGCDRLSLSRLEPSGHCGLGHACTPAALLGWMEFAYDRRPEAWLLGIPCASFDVGKQLSSVAATSLPEALERIEKWLGDDCAGPVLMMSEEEA